MSISRVMELRKQCSTQTNGRQGELDKQATGDCWVQTVAAGMTRTNNQQAWEQQARSEGINRLGSEIVGLTKPRI